MSKPRREPPYGYQGAVRAFSLTIIAFGLIILGLTIARGGSPTSTGFLFGFLFIGLGIGRLYLSRRK